MFELGACHSNTFRKASAMHPSRLNDFAATPLRVALDGQAAARQVA
ncbi:protein of unknown function [Burkholderia multivorans]